MLILEVFIVDLKPGLTRFENKSLTRLPDMEITLLYALK